MTSGISQTQPLQFSSYRYVIAVLALASHFSIGVSMFSASPILLNIIGDYGISRATAGFLVSLPLLVASAVGLPGGVITVRLGVRTTFTLGSWMVGMVVFSAFAPNFPVLLGLRLLYGLGAALLLIATGPLLMQWFKPKEVLVMNGLNTAMLSLGIAFSVSTAAPLSGLVGWREALSLYGVVGVGGAALWSLLGRARTRATTVVTGMPVREIGGVLKDRAIILLLAADAGVLVQYTSLSGWLPTFYTEVRGMTPEGAGLITGLLPFVGVFAVLLGAFLPLRVGTPRSYLILPGVMVIVGGLGTFLFSSNFAIYASLLVVGIGSWLYVPTLLSTTMAVAKGDPRKVAVIWGSLLTFSGAAMFISPIMVGVLRDLLDSFTAGFLICCAASSTLLAAGVFLPRRERQET